MNFALSQRGDAPGVNHLGFQTESGQELHDKHARLQAADAGLIEHTGQTCCYARSDKNWVTGPAGIAWETFHSLGSIPVLGEDMPSGPDSRTFCPG